MLTLENLKTFSEDLNIIRIELDELLKVRADEKLFSSSDDYYNALKVCNYYPQDFFKLRFFDYEIYLKFNNRIKKFYIKCDSVKTIDYSNVVFEDLFKQYNLKLDNTFKNIIIPEDFKFLECLKIFGKFIKVFIDYYFSLDKLFAYEL